MTSPPAKSFGEPGRQRPWLRENAEAKKAVRIPFPSHGSLKRRELRKFLALFALSGSNCVLWSGVLPWEAIEGASRKKILTNFRQYTFSRSQGPRWPKEAG